MLERIGDEWLGHVLAPESVLRMPEIGIEVPLSELHEDVEFAAVPPEGGSADR